MEMVTNIIKKMDNLIDEIKDCENLEEVNDSKDFFKTDIEPMFRLITNCYKTSLIVNILDDKQRQEKSPEYYKMAKKFIELKNILTETKIMYEIKNNIGR